MLGKKREFFFLFCHSRNPLKPLEVPRTPGLPLMDEDLKEFGGLRGQRLYGLNLARLLININNINFTMFLYIG